MSERAIPEIDWSSTSRSRPSPKPVLALLGVFVIAAVFLRQWLLAPADAPLLGYTVSRLDWLWLVSLWLTVSYLLVPAARNPETVREFFAFLAASPTRLVAAAVTTGVILAGTIGPVIFPQPAIDLVAGNQPPVFTRVTTEVVNNCLNPVGNWCYGSWAHPLGTMSDGRDVLHMLVIGARVVVELSMVGVMLIIPVGVTGGVVAAYVGGRTDLLLTSVAEAVKAVPALLAFLAWRWVSDEGTTFMLAASFGLLGWGSVATVVRSRALTETAKEYVRAAELNGASARQVLRWHLVPNVSRTALGAAVFQVPVFVIYEAALSYLTFGSPPSPLLLAKSTHISWGNMIGSSLSGFDPYWWRTVLPVVALSLTVLSTYALADVIQAFFDPQAAEPGADE